MVGTPLSSSRLISTFWRLLEIKMGKVTYKEAGVDIQAADEFVSRIRGKPKTNTVEAFASSFPLKSIMHRYKNPLLVSSCDGVGTKLKIAQELGIHNTVGIDLVAMNVNDIICFGARPLFFLDYIACGKVKVDVLVEVVKGIKKGVHQAGCVLLGGETAEMPGMYSKDEYDLAGFCVGVVDKQEIIDGRKIKAGDVVVGLSSSGIHSNGYSLVRKVFNKNEREKYASQLLKPTRIYVKEVLSILSIVNKKKKIIRGIAHVTGGAFYNKVTKIVPDGFCMVIDRRRWSPPRIFKLIQDKGNIDDREMYTVFNMGIGMVIVVDARKAEDVLLVCRKFRLPAYVIGEITKGREKLKLL